MRSIPRITDWPWYAWLFIPYPILHLFSQNITLIREYEVLQAIGVMLLVTTVMFFATLVLVRNAYTAALMILVIQVVFFTYGPLYQALDGTGQNLLMPVMLPGGLLVGVLVCRANETPQKLAPYLNIITIFLVIFPIWKITTFYFEQSKTNLIDNLVVIEQASTPRINNDLAHPDIYYIILDGYPSNAFLLRQNGYDNSAFTDALEERGFYVAYDSRSNYGKTFASLASSLNMRYIDPAERPPVPDANPYLLSLISNNQVAQRLQADYGYTYVNILSGYALPSTLADINIEFYPDKTEYFRGSEVNLAGSGSWHYKQSIWPLLLQTTLLRSWASAADIEVLAAEHYFGQQGLPYSWRSAERARVVYNALETIPQMPEATFTFAHIMKPHEPVVFDREGNTVSDDLVMQDLEFHYFEQLHYINTRTLEVIDTILANSSVPPVIVIQGDHGSDLGEAEDQDGAYKIFDILNAYHFPDSGAGVLSQDITPVNSFGLMFDYYFGETYTPLPNRHFDIPKGLDDMFLYVEIVEDGRLNVDLGDSTILLYPAATESGEAGIDLFTVDSDGNPDSLLFTLMQAEIAQHLSTPPIENVAVVSNDLVTVYALTTSEIQFNIGPDSDGRVWAVIMDDIPPKLIYGYLANP